MPSSNAVSMFSRVVPRLRKTNPRGIIRFSCNLLVTFAVFVLIAAPAKSRAQNFTIIVLPDTQYYSQNSPSIVAAQTQWIANNLSALNIKAVLGLGDLVEGGGNISQWELVDSGMRILEGKVPYFMVIGNHDYDRDDPPHRTASTINFNKYFGPSRYMHSYSGYGQSYTPGSNENFYGSVIINGKQYIFLLLEFYPRMGALRWATEVIRSNPSAEFIVVTHGYEYFDNSHVALDDRYNAEYYGMGADNDGDEMWVNLISQFSNVSLVLGGHIVNGSNPAAGHQTEPGMKGNIVNEMLSNYQNLTNGGNGYLRILEFDTSTNQIKVSTYSPILNSYLTDSANAFVVAWHGNSTTGSGTIKGRVWTDTGTPVPGAIVSSYVNSTTSDAAGKFTLSNVPSGVRTIKVQAGGYPSVIKLVPVNPLATANPLFYVTNARGAVTGHVTNFLTGAAIVGATVTQNGISSTTDAAGQYTLSAVPAVSTQVIATATGYTRLVQQISITSGGTATLDLPMMPTSSTAAGSVSGTVRNALTGSAVRGATVLYAEGSATTDANGHYKLSGVPAGSVSFTASALGLQSLSASSNVAGGQTVTKDWSLSPIASGSVSGTVMDAYTGQPIAWGTVGYSGANTGTDADGHYTLSLVPIGSQVITASDFSHQDQSQTVSVSQNGTATANFSLRASAVGTLTGKITDANTGLPILGAAVSFLGGDALTNNTGTYTLTNVPQGSGSLEASAPGYISNALNVSVLANQTTVQDLALQPSTPGTGQVAGVVTDGANPIAGASVRYSGASELTASDGSFSFNGVPPGNITFTASKAGFNSSSKTVLVDVGQTTTLNFALSIAQSTGTITGKITNASTGAALSGATVSVAGQSTTSSSTGTFSFASVTSGTYTITASKSGWLSASASVNVTAGQTANVNLALATSGKISGTVTTAGGSLDGGVTVKVSGGVIATNVTLTTNSAGAYSSNWIPVGAYTITISQTGHTTQSKPATVTSGATTSVNFTGF